MRTLRVTLAAISLVGMTAIAFADSPSAARSEAAEFVDKAAQNALTEIELGKLAQQNAQSNGINALGSRMARDHGRMKTMLWHISRDKGYAVPDSLDREHQAIVDALSAKSGAEFDATYAALMVGDHTRAIALFTQAAESNDPDIAEFARSALPALREQKRLADVFQKSTPSYHLEAALQR